MDPSSNDRQLSALPEVALALASEVDPRRLFEGIVHGARKLLGAPVAAVASWDPGSEELVLEANAGIEFPRGSITPAEAPGCMGRAFADRHPVVVADLSSAPRVHPLARKLKLRAALAAPLLREGRACGVVFVAHLAPEPRFDAEDVRTLEILAGHAALALGHAETVAATARRMARVEEHEIALRGIVEARSRQVVIERAFDCATTVLGADRAAVVLVEPDQTVKAVAGRRLSRAYLLALAAGYQRSAGGVLLFTHAPMFIADAATDPRTRPIHHAAAREGIHTALLLPLVRSDDLLGALVLHHDLPLTYAAEDISLARQLADQLTLALSNAVLHEQSERQLAQLRVLESMVRAISAPATVAERARRGAQAVVDGGGAQAVWVFLLEGEALRLVAQAGAAALTDGVVVASARDALRQGAITSRPEGAADALSAASISCQGRPLGALVLAPPSPHRVEPRPHTTFLCCDDKESSTARCTGSELRDFVATAAGQLATAITNARLLEETATMSARLEAVLACMPSAVFVFDRDDRVVLYNDRAKDIYGIGDRDLHGWRPEDFIREVGHCLRDPTMPAEIARRVKEERHRIHRMEFEVVRPRRAVIERISAPLCGGDGLPLGQVVLYHELTELRDLEWARASFTRRAGWALKRPLELARRAARAGDVPAEELDELLRRIEEAVDELLDVAALEAGQLELSPEPFDLADLLRGTVDRERQGIGTRRLALTLPERPVVVTGDQRRLGRVLRHALREACGHASDDATLQVALHAEGRWTVVSFRAPLMPGVLEPTSPGDGYARRLSREIAVRHGGDLDVATEDGLLAVKLRIPIEAAS